jgi:hypothetical protein
MRKDEDKMIKVINEQIAMLAAFQLDGTIMPVLFSWQGQKYRDFEVTATRTVPEGSFVKFYFDLKIDATTYEVYFYTKQSIWVLSKIHT